MDKMQASLNLLKKLEIDFKNYKALMDALSHAIKSWDWSMCDLQKNLAIEIPKESAYWFNLSIIQDDLELVNSRIAFLLKAKKKILRLYEWHEEKKDLVLVKDGLWELEDLEDYFEDQVEAQEEELELEDLADYYQDFE